MSKERTPLGWGQRFRDLAKERGLSLGQLAERLDRAESTVRSWTNGTRDINLSEFLELCTAAGIDPALVLFRDKVDAKFLVIGDAWSQADANEKEVFWTVAQGILARRGNGTRGALPAQGHGRRASGRARP